jgi:beta-glucosidase
MTDIDEMLATATLEEKVAMMSGRGFFAALAEDGGVWGARPYRAGGGLESAGIEPLFFTDGPRGVVRGQSTCFPCSMARGASFDVDLERRIGEAMGIEARAQGCTLSGAVCINLLRHPAWGRAQETYGEDPHHLGRMGAALGTGIQAHGVIATVKHFALNSMENARFTIDIRVDERSLHEIYLPHFKHCLDAGIGSVMSAYNKLNGEYCGQNRQLLTDILRSEWGFTGFVHSDWVLGVYQPYGAAAGLDVENPEPIVFGERLRKAVDEGTIEPQVIDLACRRILSTQARIVDRELPLATYDEALVASPAHRALALEAAEKSAVLLENNGVLPLDRTKVRRLAVLGRLAALENTGDNGSSRVRAPDIVTALEGLRRFLGADAVVAGDEGNLAAAADAASSADVVVVVAGYTAEEEGEFIPGDLALGQAGSEHAIPEVLKEARKNAPPRPTSIGGDRLDLGLPEDQVALIRAAAGTGKPVIVVLVAGSAVLVEEWREEVGAILQTFYSGMEGGTALANLLFGVISPSGKLPFTVARRAEDYPFFDRDAKVITYDYWHGYAKLERDGVEPRYAFGHGLSYTRFTYRALHVQRQSGRLAVSVAVRNDGEVAASEVIQLFVSAPAAVQPRWPKMLKAFARISLAPGETKIVDLEVPLDELQWRNPQTHQWLLEHGEYVVHVGSSSVHLPLSAKVTL